MLIQAIYYYYVLFRRKIARKNVKERPHKNRVECNTMIDNTVQYLIL